MESLSRVYPDYLYRIFIINGIKTAIKDNLNSMTIAPILPFLCTYGALSVHSQCT